MLWDVFISHASEDKNDVVRPLEALLCETGLRVWMDEQQLVLGDSLSRKINDGLALSRFGVLILSKKFLEKDYPQREMQALLARQSANERYILPILHQVDHSLLIRRFPLLSDLLSISTDRGLEHVAAAIQRAVASLPLTSSTAVGERYFNEFQFPAELISGSIHAIHALGSPSIWQHFAATRDMGKADTWMGTDSEELVTLLFELYAPIVHFAKHRYRLQRTISTLKPSDQVRFVLLDSALDALTKDASIAASNPRLTYSPRVPQWRQRRTLEPAEFWWQGLTLERLQDAVPSFYDLDTVEALPSLSSFRQAYSVGYRAFFGGQQTLRLLANALYDFTPMTRPVYWRLVTIWHCLYTSILALPAAGTSDQLTKLFVESPWIDAGFPNHSLSPDLLPEPLSSTRSAVHAYHTSYIQPRLMEVLE
jgi:hypothetical protein